MTVNWSEETNLDVLEHELVGAPIIPSGVEKKDPKAIKVLLGLSGGVDSAIAAWVLKEQGFDVTCCFMRNWDSFANGDGAGNPDLLNDVCPQEQDYHDAQAVADKLGLTLLRVDFVREYWDDVFSTFLKEYERGRTPNPDILCNQFIKFDAFFIMQ